MHEHYRNPVFQRLLLATGSREELIWWLVWNDPSGIWANEDSSAGGWRAITLRAARATMKKMICE